MSRGHSEIYKTSEIFSSYVRKAKEKSVFIEAFSKRLPKKGDFSLVDFGCNDGELILRVLSKLNPPKGTEITGVERVSSAIETFRSSRLPKNIHFDFVENDIESFLKKNRKIFDWALASHSLYWSRDLKGVIQKICRCARNVVIVHVDKGGFHELEKRFWPLVRKTSGPLYSAEDISDVLTSLKTKFERQVIPVEVEIHPRKSMGFKRQVGLFLDSPIEKLSEKALNQVWEYVSHFGKAFPYNVSFFWIKGKPK